jgi:hypothetical protein
VAPARLAHDDGDPLDVVVGHRLAVPALLDPLGVAGGAGGPGAQRVRTGGVGEAGQGAPALAPDEDFSEFTGDY